jgi:hypothetical protein
VAYGRYYRTARVAKSRKAIQRDFKVGPIGKGAKATWPPCFNVLLKIPPDSSKYVVCSIVEGHGLPVERGY